MKKASAILGAQRGEAAYPSRHLPAGERRDANIAYILRAAAQVFAQKGFGMASVRDVAASAHTSFPRIYYYLQSKEELLYLICRRAFEELLASAGERITQSNDPEEQLRLAIASHVEYHSNNPAEMKVLVHDANGLSGRWSEHIARLRRNYSRLFRELTDQMAAKYGKNLGPDRARVLTGLLLGTMNSLHTWYDLPRDNEQRAKVAEEICRMVTGAIAGP